MTDKEFEEVGAVALGMVGAVCVAISVGLIFGAAIGFLSIGAVFLSVAVWTS